MTVEEFQINQRFMVVKMSEEHTGDGEGIEIVEMHDYDNLDGHMGVSDVSGQEIPRTKGVYCKKIWHLASRVPGYVKALLPGTMLKVIEESWNAYPHW